MAVVLVQTGHVAMVPLQGNRFLEMMSETTVGWMLLEGASVALEKKAALPAVEFKAKLMGDEDKSPIDISDASFATV